MDVICDEPIMSTNEMQYDSDLLEKVTSFCFDSFGPMVEFTKISKTIATPFILFLSKI